MSKKLIIILAVIVLALGIPAITMASVPQQILVSILGWYNPVTQQYCPYPMAGLQLPCQMIPSNLVPTVVPRCNWYPWQPKPSCPLGRITITVNWEAVP